MKKLTPTEFLRKKKIITAPAKDLMIGFSDESEESLISLLEEYHQYIITKPVIPEKDRCNCGKPSYEVYEPCCSLNCWYEMFEAE